MNEVKIHVKAEDHASGAMAGIGKKVEVEAKRSFLKSGGHAGAAFAAGFIKTITLGQVGSGFAMAATRMAPQMAHLGGALGVSLAAALVVKLASAVSALLPAALGGGMLAGPLIYLWKTQEKAVDNLKKRVGGFLDFISQPVRMPFLNALQTIGDQLDRWAPKVQDAFRSLGPALKPLTKGALGALGEMFGEIGKKLPSITAGLKEWGRVLPRIGKAAGKALGDWMGNADETRKSIDKLADSLVDLLGAVGAVGRGFRKFNKINDQFVELRDSQEKFIRGFRTGIISLFRSMPGRIASALSSLSNRVASEFNQARTAAVSRARSLISGAVSILRSLPGRAAGAIGALSSRVASEVSQARSAAISRAHALVSGFISIMRTLPGKARAAISSIRSRIVGAFSGAGSWLVSAGRRIITGLVSGIRSAAGAAASAAASVVRRAISAARSLIPGRASGGNVSSTAAGGGARGGQVLVGEQGPEIVDLPFGSHVNSNADSRRIGMGEGGGGGGGVHFHFHGPVYGDHNALKRALVNMKRSGDLDLVLR